MNDKKTLPIVDDDIAHRTMLLILLELTIRDFWGG